MIRPQLLLLSLVVLLGCFQTVQSAAADDRSPLWPIPIPYAFESSYNETQRKEVRDSLATFYDSTCLEFKEDSAAEIKILYTIDATKSCSAEIRYWETAVKVFLQPTCIGSVGIQHETVHALGFRHTQVRNDRDAYVTVNPAVINKSNYKKLDASLNPKYGLPYEYSSLLHYSADEDLWPNDADYVGSMGVGGEMVFNDWKLVNMHYKCGEKCTVPLTCNNGGYQHPRKCTECVCPRFHTGKQCEQERDVVTLVPGQPRLVKYVNVHDETVFNQNIGKFNRSPFTLVKAPEGTRIRVTIDKIADNDSPWYMPKQCAYPTRAVEIVDGDMTRGGKKFCANTSTGRSFVSETNVVGYHAFAPLGYGFSADVTFTVEN